MKKEKEELDLVRFIIESPKAVDGIPASGNFTDEKGLISNIKTADEAFSFCNKALFKLKASYDESHFSKFFRIYKI